MPLRRSIDRFMSDPASLRNAARLMIGATVVIVLVGGLVVWLFDSQSSRTTAAPCGTRSRR